MFPDFIGELKFSARGLRPPVLRTETFGSICAAVY
jgi:hypothetical protein